MLKAISFHVLAGDESGVSDELVYGRQKIRQSGGVVKEPMRLR